MPPFCIISLLLAAACQSFDFGFNCSYTNNNNKMPNNNCSKSSFSSTSIAYSLLNLWLWCCKLLCSNYKNTVFFSLCFMRRQLLATKHIIMHLKRRIKYRTHTYTYTHISRRSFGTLWQRWYLCCGEWWR